MSRAPKDFVWNLTAKPTMKQKVRFILRAREEGSAAIEMPERAAEAVDAIIGSLARSAYNAGSVVTHVSGERRTVVMLKRYVEVVLSHLLLL
jgi:predicted nuclease with RNAse H fold